ncbi:hypothetical protein ZOSMA_37G00760 [Zostera marina]|uniref:LysM domain-containing protein n=1 Tax=Zostera marina TaxID=29655 RepID=A0A0K9P592_ZOSMR|nr:hypothetical protein ZOSMA_37G00760 [Zostera marina]
MANSSALKAVVRVSRVVDAANTVSICCAAMLVMLILLSPLMESCLLSRKGNNRRRACDEIYMVREGETLNSISDKCNDPYIIEHIQDPDDVFPGLVVWIIPAKST